MSASSWIHPPDLSSGLSAALSTSSAHDSGWEEPAEVAEDSAKMMIKMAVPGVGREDLSIEVREDVLVVSGTRRSMPGEKAYGSFYRVFSVPAATRLDAVEARLVGDDLHIEIPKVADSMRIPFSIG